MSDFTIQRVNGRDVLEYHHQYGGFQFYIVPDIREETDTHVHFSSDMNLDKALMRVIGREAMLRLTQVADRVGMTLGENPTMQDLKKVIRAFKKIPDPEASRITYNATILVVEDSEVDWQVVHRAFSQYHADAYLQRAKTGQQAFDYLLHQGEYAKEKPQLPALIVLDWNLPDMKGSDVARKLKEHPVLKDIPVVVMTGYLTKELATELNEIGVNAYMPKPEHLGEFSRAVRTMADFWMQHAFVNLEF